MNDALPAFLSVLAVSAVSLVGLLTLSMSQARVIRLASLFISFAVGALLGDTFIHLVPEIFARSRPLGASLLILCGIMVFFIVEKLLRHRHSHGRPELVAVNLLGDAIHNYIDGLLIGASWMVSPTLGLSTTIAVLLHEVPQELGDFGILIHSGLTIRKATALNVASAAVAILGTATVFVAGAVAHQRLADVLVPMTAGGFVYIAAADLIPELQEDRSLRGLAVQTALIAAGIGVMAALAVVE